jgi:hypothetical protein
MTYLQKLLGDTWVDAEIFGPNPRHCLGRWQKKDPNNIWVPYVEGLAKLLLTDRRIKVVAKDLKRKFKSEFLSTLAEMETAVFLAQQGFVVTLEPTVPKKGPDMVAEWEGISYFVEIREAGLSWEDERIQQISNFVFSALESIPSNYSVDFTIGNSYTAKSPQLKAAMRVVLDAFEIVKNEKIEKATLYYVHPDGKLLNRGGDMSRGISETKEKYREIVAKADFVARFVDLGEERRGTAATLSRKLKSPPERVKSHERLKSILIDKCGQLPKDARNLIVLDVSEQFMLSDFSIETALYGDWEVGPPRVSGPSEPVGDLTVQSNERGFFGLTARVSAVVFHKRIVEQNEINGSWHVYPTNRANPDTIRLNLEELERFGEIGDRQQLSAENLPNQPS